MARKRIIYQSEALFSGPSGGGNTVLQNGMPAIQLHRVQDISHSVDVTRTDILEFDRLAALSREIIEAPTVGLDFTYYVVDGYNEASGLGLSVQGHGLTTPESCLSGILKQNSEKDIQSWYIATTPEGEDAAQGPGSECWASGAGDKNVIAIGNGGLTSYSVEAAVGDIPSASCSVEGANILFHNSVANIPAHTIQQNGTVGGSGVNLTGCVTTGTLQAMALRPGDVTLDFGSSRIDMGGAILPGASNGTVSNVQSVSLEVPLSRTPLNRLGNAFSYARTIDTPITATLSVSAQLTDTQTGMLSDLICSEGSRDITIAMNTRCGTDTDARAFLITLKGASLDSQNMSSTIGDNKTVDLTFSVPVGQARDQGVFLSGKA